MANLEVIALDTATPQLRAPASGDGYSMARPLTLNGGTVTANAPVLNISQTWNNAADVFNAFDLQVFDTASAAGSKPFRIRGGAAGTTELSSIDNVGNHYLAGGVHCASVWPTNGVIGSGISAGYYTPGGFSCTAGYAIGASVNLPDVFWTRDAPNTLALKNGTAAQTFNLYNTFTDASNYERGFVRWSANAFEIGSEMAGTGVGRELRLKSSSIYYTINKYVATDPILEFYNNSTRRAYLFATASALQIGVDFGNLSLYPSTGLVQLNGTGGGFPALKRSGADLHIRLADDSAFAAVKGKLTTDTAAAVGTITPDKTLIIYDGTGAAYKVGAVLA